MTKLMISCPVIFVGETSWIYKRAEEEPQHYGSGMSQSRDAGEFVSQAGMSRFRVGLLYITAGGVLDKLGVFGSFLEESKDLGRNL